MRKGVEGVRNLFDKLRASLPAGVEIVPWRASHSDGMEISNFSTGIRAKVISLEVKKAPLPDASGIFLFFKGNGFNDTNVQTNPGFVIPSHRRLAFHHSSNNQ